MSYKRFMFSIPEIDIEKLRPIQMPEFEENFLVNTFLKILEERTIDGEFEVLNNNKINKLEI